MHLILLYAQMIVALGRTVRVCQKNERGCRWSRRRIYLVKIVLPAAGVILDIYHNLRQRVAISLDNANLTWGEFIIYTNGSHDGGFDKLETGHYMRGL